MLSGKTWLESSRITLRHLCQWIRVQLRRRNGKTRVICWCWVVPSGSGIWINGVVDWWPPRCRVCFLAQDTIRISVSAKSIARALTACRQNKARANGAYEQAWTQKIQDATSFCGKLFRKDVWWEMKRREYVVARGTRACG